MDTLNILLEITVYSAVIFMAIILLKICFKQKMSPFLHYIVWFVLVLRLMMPVTIASPVRLFVIPAQSQNQAAIEQTQPQAYDPVSVPNINEADITDTQPQTAAAEQYITSEPQTAHVAAQIPATVSLPQVLTLVWLVGAGMCLMYLALLYASLRRKLRMNAAQPSKALMALFEEAKTELGIKANIKLVCCYEYGTPSLMFPRTIMMPVDALVAMDEEQTNFALRHELMHYRRGDHVISILLSLLNALYWFNPFVWLAFRQMRADIETACDSKVVKLLSAAARSRYASLILNLSSRPAHRQLALGMSDSNAKKAAERRVKGIYMKGKSKMSVKLITVLLAVTLIFTCFTTACQPIPEALAAVNKSNEILANAAENTAAPLTVYEARETWKGSFQREDSILSIDINATVDTPDVDAYPVAIISPSKFTQEQADKMVQVLFQGKTVYNSGGLLTKTELMDSLAEARAGLEMKKTDPKSSDNSIEDFEIVINEIEALIPNAPDSRDNEPASTQLRVNEYNEIRLDLRADLGKEENATLTMIVEDPANQQTCFARFINTGNGGPYNSFDDWNLPADTPLSLEITEDDAISQAKKLLDNLAITGMDVAQVAPGVIGGAEGSDVSGNPKCYMIYFSRTVDGIPTTFGTNVTSDELSNPNDRPASDSSAPWASESILVCIDDSGITQFEWVSPVKVTEKATDNIALLPFDQIKEIFEEQMFIKYGHVEDDGLLAKQTYHIENIKLGLARIQSKDNPNEYMLVPVWNFFGSIENSFDMNAVSARMKELDPASADENIKWYEEQNNKILSNGFQSFLTINAIDGSLIG